MIVGTIWAALMRLVTLSKIYPRHGVCFVFAALCMGALPAVAQQPQQQSVGQQIDNAETVRQSESQQTADKNDERIKGTRVFGIVPK